MIFFHVSCIILAWTISPIFCKTGVNKIRVCSGEESIELTDSACDRGWWIPEAIKPECVCVTGTWLLSENYCDENFILISGPASDDSTGNEFTCFQHPEDLRRVVSLSQQTKNYHQFLIQSNGRHIEKMEMKSITPAETAPVVIIRLNAKTEIYLMHKEGVQSAIWQRCLGRKISNAGKPYTHIIKVDDTVSLLKSVDGNEVCDDVRDIEFPYEQSNRTDWLIEKEGSFGWSIRGGQLPINPCTCPPPPSRMSKVLRPKSFSGTSPFHSPEEKIRSSPLRNTDPDYDSLPGDSFNIYPKNRDPLVHQEHLIDNARTSASILTKLKDFVLTGSRPSPFRNPLFEYVRYGKRILTRFCPEIRPEVVGNLIGMFRILLGNIIGKYPEEYSLNVDSAVHQRVLSSLARCYESVSSRNVKFFWGNVRTNSIPVEGQGNCTGKSRRRIQSLQVDGQNISLNGQGMPKELRFINGDVMLEVAWKILLGTHYVCSEGFEKYPEDLSFMYVKAQEFLTIPYVMFRWENPAKGLTDAYKILNPLLNADELGEQIDACVLAAFEFSSFNTWLGRPASEREFIPKTVMQKAVDKLTGAMFVGEGKSKGGITSKVLDNKLAYCVHDFNDPLGWSEVDNPTTKITGC